MAQYHFPLEKVRRWRALELASEEAKLERMVSAQLQLQTLWANLSDERTRLDTSPATLPDLRGADLRVITACRLRLQRQATKLVRLLQDCDAQLVEQRKKYRLAKQRYRLLEELKARKLAEWRHQQDAELETLAGESFLAAWNRTASNR
jgi:hypothetical protein